MSAVVPVVVLDVGLKVPVTPVGSPVAENVTAEVNPPAIVSVPVSVAVPPPATEIDAGETEREKFFTVSVTVIV